MGSAGFELFSANEYTAAKEFEGKKVAVFGKISGVEKSYYKGRGTNTAGKRGEFPCISMTLGSKVFSGYLLNDKIDPSTLNQGEAIILVCDSIEKSTLGAQGVCQVAMTGPMNSDGVMDPRYLDEKLKLFLYGK